MLAVMWQGNSEAVHSIWASFPEKGYNNNNVIAYTHAFLIVTATTTTIRIKSRMRIKRRG